MRLRPASPCRPRCGCCKVQRPFGHDRLEEMMSRTYRSTGRAGGLKSALAAFLVAMACAVAAPGSPARVDAKRIQELIRASGAEGVAVAYYDLETRETLLINPDESFHAASTMKLPVMV